MDNKNIYYYCDVSTALSILQNQEIWMTCVRNLNDGNEQIGVYKLFYELLEEYDYNHSKRLRGIYNYATQPGLIQIDESPLGGYPQYVACFSKNADSVAQWIAYADDGHGLAIGFSENDLKCIANCEELQYHEIAYVNNMQINKEIPELYKHLMKNYCEDIHTMMFQAMDYIREKYPLGITYKTSHYESEQEKRIVYQAPHTINNLPAGWEIEKVKTYAKRNMINTYVPLKFPKEAIKAIVTGPKYAKNYYEVENALETLGYRVDLIELSESTSGYR